MMNNVKPILDKIYRPLYGENLNYSLGRLENMLEAYELDLNPDYQRGHVWTPEQSSAFVGHVLSGGSTTQLIINVPRYGPSFVCEMIDGQQRFKACLAWVRGEIPAVTWEGQTLWYHDMDSVSKTMLNTTIVLSFLCVCLTRKERMELYIRLNRGGTVHTDEEIARVQRLLTEIE